MVDASEDHNGIGKCIEITGINQHQVISGLHTFLLRGNDDLIAIGFRAYLQDIPAIKNAMMRFATGISVYGVSKKKGSIEFSIPSPPEQTAIATVLSDMDAEIAALQQRCDKTRALKQGMMQELLT